MASSTWHSVSIVKCHDTGISNLIPGIWIYPNCQINTITLFEQDKAPLKNPVVKLISYPIIDGPTPNSVKHGWKLNLFYQKYILQVWQIIIKILQNYNKKNLN